jgi:hypothetical protein
MSRSSRFALVSMMLAQQACSHRAAPPQVPAAAARSGESSWIIHQAPHASPNAAYRWLDIALEATARDVDRLGARPPIISREVSIYVTAMYDAWAAYDDKAVGTRLGGKLRRPPAERTPANREKAIAYAVYRALLYLYPSDTRWLEDQMRGAGYDPGDATADVSKPQGVGNVAAGAIIEFRRGDGANQHGDEPGSNGTPYSDYTGYKPKNPNDAIVDPDRWQPLPFSDGKGGTIYPGFLTPHWYRVKPFALERADQFRPGPYPKVGTVALKQEVDECIAYNGSLSLEQKAIVEFMRDGPRSTGQSGHWLRFAQDVSRRDKNDLERDVKLFFAVGNVTFDAFTACWEAKRYYSSRPWTLIRHLYKGKRITGYAGACRGFAEVASESWHPYSPSTFVTPPFPGYPSGHSTASGAASKLLELFTGSDRYGAVAHRKAGELTEPGCPGARMQARQGAIVAASSMAQSTDVVLKLPTFSATAEMAGISRIMGGYHIQADNVAGLELGRTIAKYSWPKYQAYFHGTAPNPPPPPTGNP